MDQVLTALQQEAIKIALILIPVIGGFLIYLITQGVAYAKEKIGTIKDERQRKLISDAIDRINDLAVKAVGSMEQTTAAELRQAVKDGKIDRAELLALGQKVYDEVYSQLSIDAVDALQKEIADVEKYIQDTVENALLHLKVETGQTLPVATALAAYIPGETLSVEPVKAE